MGERSGVVACSPTSGPKVRVVKWALQQRLEGGAGKIPQSPITGKLVGRRIQFSQERVPKPGPLVESLGRTENKSPMFIQRNTAAHLLYPLIAPGALDLGP